jgi:hypothetical protein
MLSAYSDAKPIGPLETMADRSILGMDPAAFLLLTTRNPEVITAYLHTRTRFTYLGPTPVAPPLAAEHAKALEKLRREFGWVGAFVPRDSRPARVVNACGRRIAWTKVNPLLTRRDRGQIKHEIRQAARGPYIPDPTAQGWRHPRTNVGDIEQAVLSREYEPKPTELLSPNGGWSAQTRIGSGSLKRRRQKLELALRLGAQGATSTAHAAVGSTRGELGRPSDPGRT